MSIGSLVHQPQSRVRGDRSLALSIQRRATQEAPRRVDARRVCEAVEERIDYNPGKLYSPALLKLGGVGLTVNGPSLRISSWQKDFIELVIKAAGDISRQYGGKGPEPSL